MKNSLQSSSISLLFGSQIARVVRELHSQLLSPFNKTSTSLVASLNWNSFKSRESWRSPKFHNGIKWNLWNFQKKKKKKIPRKYQKYVSNSRVRIKQKSISKDLALRGFSIMLKGLLLHCWFCWLWFFWVDWDWFGGVRYSLMMHTAATKSRMKSRKVIIGRCIPQYLADRNI